MLKKLAVADSSTVFKLIRLVNLISRPFNEVAGKPHQLTLNEWRVMVVLASHPGASATDVVYYTGLDKMGVSRALARLIKLNRVERKPDPEDARRAQVRLTPSGFLLAKEIAQSAAQREASLLATLSATEQTKLVNLLDRLAAATES